LSEKFAAYFLLNPSKFQMQLVAAGGGHKEHNIIKQGKYSSIGLR